MAFILNVAKSFQHKRFCILINFTLSGDHTNIFTEQGFKHIFYYGNKKHYFLYGWWSFLWGTLSFISHQASSQPIISNRFFIHFWVKSIGLRNTRKT